MANTTDKSILTAAGKALLAQLNAEEKPLIIDKMIFANVPNRPEFPQPDDVVPTDDIVHQEQVEQRGRLSADSVIYSTTLTSDVGPFEFNWTGAYCSEYGVLVTIDHHAITPKTADEPGVAGNTLVRSVVLEYKDIAEITNITVDASSWQYNATDRMKKMDSDVAQSIIDQNGKDWFIEDGFLVTPSGSAYNIKAGAGYVSGNRVSMEFDRSVQVPNKPSYIYIDAHREGTPTGEQVTLFDFVITAEEKDDYIDSSTGKDISHFVCKIAKVLADGTVSDLRGVGGTKMMTMSLPTFTSFTDRSLDCEHVITRGYYSPGDKGSAEFTFTGNVKLEEAGKSHLDIGLVYDSKGREFEIVSSPLNYRQFGAVLDGQTSVMQQIKDCHDCANLKLVPVENEDGKALIDDSHLVVINTNVDWGMTEFIIDSSVGNPATWSMPVLFRAEGNPLETFLLPLNKSEFYESSSWLPSLATLHNAFIFIDSDTPHIKRYPSSSTFENKREPNRVGKNGELNKPLRFDYTQSESLTVQYRNMEQCYITIKGGFLDQNGSPSHIFLEIARNNTIWHLVGFKDKTNSDQKNIRAPMSYSMCADVRLIDVNAEAPTRLDGTDGTYGLSGTGVVDLYLENLNAYCGYGFAGMNLVNGVTLKSCKINRFDGHFGLWDLLAEDTHFKEWGILVGSGGGYLKLKNCSKFFGKSTKLNSKDYGFSDVVQLRPDYASEWRGTIEIDGLRMIVDTSMSRDIGLQIVKFHCDGDYGASHIVEWARNIIIKDVVIEAPDSHLTYQAFGVVCVDFSNNAITTGTRLPARVIIDNVNYSKENPNAYISAVNGPKDLYVKMNAEAGDAADGAHNAVWSVSRIFNANRNPRYNEGNSPGAETLVQYAPNTNERNIGADRIKLRILISQCTMFDVEITVSHYLEVHGGSCVAYDQYSGSFASDGIAWFHNCQIMPLPVDSTGKPEFGPHHLRGCSILKTDAGYTASYLRSSQGVLVEKDVVITGSVTPSMMFNGYLSDSRFEPVA